MQETSERYNEAITGSYRKIVPRAVVDLIDPDIAYDGVTSNGAFNYSDPGQIYDKKLSGNGPVYGTMELNRWVLDGSTEAMPDQPSEMTGSHGYLMTQMSGEDGCFQGPYPYTELEVSNLSILQAASVCFTGRECDGYGVDFTLGIYSGETVAYSKQITENREKSVFFDSFTVQNVSKLRVTVQKWSFPYRHPRICEILPGIYETWEGGELEKADVVQETDFTCQTVPYGTCALTVHNKNKRFNPFSKNSLFRSIEERQGIPISYGVQLNENEAEYVPLGIYYQQNGGWETSAYGMTINFKLVDIMGLLANRDYKAPETLPETLAGWIESVTMQLGENFRKRYEVAEDIANTALTISGKTMAESMTCGQIVRYACMAAKAFWRADAKTGKLKIEQLPEIGGTVIDLKNMHSYPKNQAGDDVAKLIFKLDDGEYVAEGTLSAAEKPITISNPFIHTEAEAAAVAEYIMQFYGKTKFTVSGRGDMQCELGDADEIETGFGGTTKGRRYKQQLKIENGIMKTAPSYLLSIDEQEELQGEEG